jgi:glyoxylase-like metal-dependent hydrolase (beta-lactamase superfamily II)
MRDGGLKMTTLALMALLCALAMVSCAREGLMVEQVVTGPETNCYLIYDSSTRQAALIDVAGPIEPLLETIDSRNLRLRYFLFTHGHFDHVMGLPPLREKFSDATVCMHRLDFADMATQGEWALANLDPEIVELIKNDPEASKMLKFDLSTFGVPDVFVTDGQELEFAGRNIRVLHSPGHSPGSVCYHVDDILFSGDVLFRDSVGRVDVQNSSRDDQIVSVRRLYSELPEETRVYPGHGDATTVGREKHENSRITADVVNM